MLDPLTKMRRLRGQYCWGVCLSPLGGLTMSFGQPHLRVREPYETRSRDASIRWLASRRLVTPSGKWWFWAYRAYWRITRSGRQLASSSSPARDISGTLGVLSGQRFLDVTIRPGDGLTRMQLDLDTVLEIRRRTRQKREEMWLFYEPNGMVLSVYSDGTYEYGPGSRKDRRKTIQRALS